MGPTRLLAGFRGLVSGLGAQPNPPSPPAPGGRTPPSSRPAQTLLQMGMLSLHVPSVLCSPLPTYWLGSSPPPPAPKCTPHAMNPSGKALTACQGMKRGSGRGAGVHVWCLGSETATLWVT